jgi:hypothetical protein
LVCRGAVIAFLAGACAKKPSYGSGGTDGGVDAPAETRSGGGSGSGVAGVGDYLPPDAGLIDPAADGGGAGVVERVDVSFNVDWRYHEGDVAGADAKAFDDTSWTYVDVPHSTRFTTPESPNAYLGVSWYRRHFTVPGAYAGSKLFIELEGAMQAADVWLNGVHVARHQGGYTPFTIDATDAIRYDGADNVLAVKLDSNANPAWAPGWNGVDFQYHGGLYRSVTLHVLNPLHVTDAVSANKVAGGGVFVRYPAVSATAATVAITTNVINQFTVARTATVLSELVDATGEVVGTATDTQAIAPGSDADFAQSLTVANPALWHPYTPNLYTLRTRVQDGSVTVDETSTRIGIRRIGWSRSGGLVINGARFAARGVNMHQEMYGVANAVPDSAIYYDVKRIKDGGLDFIRAAHYPHAPAFYAACDALGVLVLNPQTGWQNFSDTTAFKEATYQELRDLIRRDRNHPSVVAWEASLNESNFTDEWAARAHAIVHEEYPGDQAFSAAWEWSRADILVDASQHGVRSSVDPRPTIIDEYGSWDYGGQNSTSNQPREGGDNAMLIQANNIEDAESKNMALSWFSADGYWHYADYTGFSSFGITRDGLVDMYRLPKLSYYFLQSQRDPGVVIAGIDSGPVVFIANQWTATSPTRVRVYGNCARVSLSLNGTLIETRSPDPGTNLLHPPFNFSLAAFTPGTLQADCLIGGVVVATHLRRTPEAGSNVVLRPEGTSLRADGSDGRLVFIDVVDVNGTVVPTASDSITLGVVGPGALLGPSVVTVKGGQLATWVRAGRTPGTITITATAPGLAAASVNLTSTPAANVPPLPPDR